MDDSGIWWILAGAAVAAELATGTFFLLLVALGLAAGAIAAHVGASVAVQVIVAALVGGGAVAGWTWIKRKHPSLAGTTERDDFNLDVGEIVQVTTWRPDGTGVVQYRGAQWSVFLRAGIAPQPGPHRVAEVVGNRLLVEPT